MASKNNDIIRKEISFSEADLDVFVFFDIMPGAFSKNVKNVMRSYMMKEEFRIDYDRIRRIVEDVVEEHAVLGLSAADIEEKKNKPEKSFFGLGKTY